MQESVCHWIVSQGFIVGDMLECYVGETTLVKQIVFERESTQKIKMIFVTLIYHDDAEFMNLM